MRRLSYFLLGLALLGLVQLPLFGEPKSETIKVPVPLPGSTPTPYPGTVPGPQLPGQYPGTLPGQYPQLPGQYPGPLSGPYPGRIAAPPPGPCLRHLDGKKLVFIADGVGESTAVTDALSDLSGDLDLRLRIQVVTWCRQDHKTHDFNDHAAQLKAACRLAGWTRLIRRDCPNADIYFVGYDAGARIVLAAAEMLAPQSIDRIILIAPGVCNTYDLRPALRTSRGGIDNFWSTEDDFLERVCESRGTSEGAKGWAAGRVGFRPPAWCDAAGVAAYRQYVHQIRWTDDMCGQGQHYAWTIRHNMKNCIVPVFFQPHITFAPPMMPAPMLAPPGPQPPFLPK